MKIITVKIPCTVLFLISLLPALFAGGVADLEEGLPIKTEDAYPIGYWGRELQTLIHYKRSETGVDEFRSEVRLELGFPRNGQIKFTVPYIFGEVEPDGLGDISGEIFYNINQETFWIPAFSVAAGVITDTGDESEGTDPVLKLVLSKLVTGRTDTYQAIHLNLSRRFNDDIQNGERNGETDLVLGFSRRITSSTLFVADVYRHWDMEEDKEENVAEIGLRYQMTPLSVISGAVGFGFGSESPDVLGTVGFQLMF